MSDSDRTESAEPAAWKPLGRHERRVLGVLIEKAKTTPDSYPLTVAGLIAGCNQKSNRSPQMQLDEDEVLDALESLRSCGAAREIQGSGRVNKYRHLAYEWLGVNSPQAAIMTELLLRGPQTGGELRSRGSRMEPFSDLETLGATLDELQRKGLVLPLTPPGRGQVFAHALYEPDELRRLRTEAGGFDAEQLTRSGAGPQRAETQPATTSGADTPPIDGATSPAAPELGVASGERGERFEALEAELQKLRNRVTRLEREFGLEEE